MTRSNGSCASGQRHIVLLTYGEPPRADFLVQLRYSWRILLGLARTVASIPAPGWLNHSVGGRWTEPPVDRALCQVVGRGYRRVIHFPFGFLADNAETPLEGRQALRAEPSLEAIHLPCWNASPEFLTALAQQLVGPPVEDLAAVASEPPAAAHGSRLDQLEPGERGVILRLEGSSGFERRLMELGLVPGTAVEMVRRAPFGDPVEIRIRDVSLSLRRSETSRIHVAPR